MYMLYKEAFLFCFIQSTHLLVKKIDNFVINSELVIHISST